MTIRKELCMLIMMHCKEGYHKHNPGKEHSYKTLANDSGVPVTTIQNWMNIDSEPSLTKAQHVLNAMGYELQIRRIEK